MGVGEGAGLETPSLVSASCSMKAENRICNPAVPLSDATLPASVVISYVGPGSLLELLLAPLGEPLGLVGLRLDFVLAAGPGLLPPLSNAARRTSPHACHDKRRYFSVN